MKKVLVLLGPTSTGKTDLGLKLARKFNGELVSCDSRQVYKGLDIGTGKLPSSKFKVQSLKFKNRWQVDGVNIWMYDVTVPNKRYTVFDYVKDAEKIVEDILKRNKLPVLVGGTGLYLKALIEGMPNLDVPISLELREELTPLSLQGLQDRLKKVSIEKWNSLNQSDRQNKRRLLRSIEIVSMYPYVKKVQSSKLKVKSWDVLKIGLSAPISNLREKINLRLKSRLAQGMIGEARQLYLNGLTLQRMKELGLEYGVLSELLVGEINQEQMIQKLQIKIGQYAKRQLTWFKKEKNVNWFNITDQNLYKEVAARVQIWYDQP